MARFEDFLKALKDGQAFFKQARTDLERWTKALARGLLSKVDFEWLVRGKKDLAEMEALQQARLALVRVDQFRSSLIDLVIGTAFKTFL